jgi:hypothetical protein
VKPVPASAWSVGGSDWALAWLESSTPKIRMRSRLVRPWPDRGVNSERIVISCLRLVAHS